LRVAVKREGKHETANCRSTLRVVNVPDGIDSESRATRMGGEGKSFGHARPSITSTSTAIAEHEYECGVRARARNRNRNARATFGPAAKPDVGPERTKATAVW